MRKGRRGRSAPGRQVSRQGSPQPSRNINRLPVLAAAVQHNQYAAVGLPNQQS